jgi:hypothetical protein
MKRLVSAAVLSLFFAAGLHASTIDTNSAAIIAAFQSGATVIDFSSVGTVTPLVISNYNTVSVPNTAKVFDQISGVRFSVGGMVGSDRPALYSLSGGIAGDAKSPSTVLGPVDFSSDSLFGPGAMIEIFFPVKVDRVGFWLNPSLSNVTIIAADTNFAFSGLPETTLETGTNVTAGNFVGIQRPTAEIGGFKILGLGGAASEGFTIDDFTFKAGTATTVPETPSLLFTGAGLVALGLVVRKFRNCPQPK